MSNTIIGFAIMRHFAQPRLARSRSRHGYPTSRAAVVRRTVILSLTMVNVALAQSPEVIERMLRPCTPMIERCTRATCGQTSAEMRELASVQLTHWIGMLAQGGANAAEVRSRITNAEAFRKRQVAANHSGILGTDVDICIATAALNGQQTGARVTPAAREPAPVQINAENGKSQFGSATTPVPPPAPNSPAAPPSKQLLDQQAREVLDELMKGRLPASTEAETNKEILEDQYKGGELADHCVHPMPGRSGGLLRLENWCEFRIEVVWCVEGVDCKPTYSNMSTMNGWKKKADPVPYLLIDGSAGKTIIDIWYGACKGANSVTFSRDSKEKLYGCIRGQP